MSIGAQTTIKAALLVTLTLTLTLTSTVTLTANTNLTEPHHLNPRPLTQPWPRTHIHKHTHTYTQDLMAKEATAGVRKKVTDTVAELAYEVGLCDYEASKS